MRTRIIAHRKDYPQATFAFIELPSKSHARKMESLLIRKLKDLGVPLWNKGDQFHQGFGVADKAPY